MKSICISLEEKFLAIIRDCVSIPVVGLFDIASAGEVKEEDLTSVSVKVSGVRQDHSRTWGFDATVEVRLVVEQSESANGEAFVDAYNRIALLIERTILVDDCEALSTNDVNVDGLGVTSTDNGFDSASGVWFASWSFEVNGRIAQ